ncbi:helix-turn-helix domain-containing protein [Methylobacterium oryzisoli]|uniref:helix-turn-helix domain-containing protein n=1 Tax=Methylobacterium oryzisoli TaxID=3385502 RepID=UPI0038927A25
MTAFGNRLIQAAEEAVAIAKGEADPATFRVHVPADIDVLAIRAALDMTQAEFARSFGFPLGTLRDLEQGRARPDSSTRAYLTVIQRDPKAVRQALTHADKK